MWDILLLFPLELEWYYSVFPPRTQVGYSSTLRLNQMRYSSAPPPRSQVGYIFSLLQEPVRYSSTSSCCQMEYSSTPYQLRYSSRSPPCRQMGYSFTLFLDQVRYSSRYFCCQVGYSFTFLHRWNEIFFYISSSYLNRVFFYQPLWPSMIFFNISFHPPLIYFDVNTSPDQTLCFMCSHFVFWNSRKRGYYKILSFVISASPIRKKLQM